MDYPTALIEQNRLLTESVLSADPETPIPTCPGWSMRQLRRHVGRAHRWAAHIISTRSDVSLDPRTVPDGRPPDDTVGERAWLLACPDLLFAAVAAVGGPDVPVATFDGLRPAQWWIRRLLHETTVHRADAVLAVAEHYELAPELAADGIDEWLGRIADRPPRVNLPVDDDKAVRLIAIDADASWTMRKESQSIQLRRNSTDELNGVQLAGSAIDLFLGLFRRCDVEDTQCEVTGDRSLWTTFLERTPFAAPGT